MKKCLLAVSTLFLTSLSVFAGGFYGNVQKATVAQTLSMPDDAYVSVQGNIVKKISPEKYLFKDATGSIVVEIEHDKWGFVEATEKDVLELTGEVERKFNSIHIDVDRVKKVN